MSNKPRILLAGRLDEDAEQRLHAGAEVVQTDETAEQILCELVVDCDGLVTRTHIQITPPIIKAGRQLRVIGVAGVGVDSVNLPAAKQRGVKVLNVPDASSDAVAEFTTGLMLQLLQPFGRLAAAYRGGEFQSLRKQPHGPELHELTVGIIGFGRIGSRVGRICSSGFGARVLYNDIIDVPLPTFRAKPVDKPTLWSESDIVTLHVPATDLTRRFINAGVLAAMKPTALLINTARGTVIDTAALIDALHSGQIAAAALDVTDPEPLPSTHPLFALSNCLITPHVAARTPGSLQRMYGIVDKTLEFLRENAAE